LGTVIPTILRKCAMTISPQFPHILGYTFLRLLGKGSMGEVYECLEEASERRVAIKVLKPEFTQNTEANNTFEKEAQLIARLKHKNIVGIYNLIHFEKQYFLIMEYCEGEPLSKILKRGLLPLNRTLKIIEGLLDALCYMHGKHIIHHDIKPGNILLLPDDHAILCDFGLSKIKASESSTEIFGTPAYMSPEKILQQMTPENEHQSDLFSLGVLFYEMVTGTHPFKGKNRASLFEQILHSHPIRPIDIQNDLPLSINTIVLKLLQKKPVSRYLSALATLSDIRNFKDNKPISSWEHSFSYDFVLWLRRQPLKASVIFLCLFSIGSFLWFSLEIKKKQGSQFENIPFFEHNAPSSVDFEKNWVGWDPSTKKLLDVNHLLSRFKTERETLIFYSYDSTLAIFQPEKWIGNFHCETTLENESMQGSCGLYFGSSGLKPKDKGIFFYLKKTQICLCYPHEDSPVLFKKEIRPAKQYLLEIQLEFPFLLCLLNQEPLWQIDLSFFPLSAPFHSVGIFSSQNKARFSSLKLLSQRGGLSTSAVTPALQLLSKGDFSGAKAILTQLQEKQNQSEALYFLALCDWHLGKPETFQKLQSSQISQMNPLFQDNAALVQYWQDFIITHSLIRHPRENWDPENPNDKRKEHKKIQRLLLLQNIFEKLSPSQDFGQFQETLSLLEVLAHNVDGSILELQHFLFVLKNLCESDSWISKDPEALHAWVEKNPQWFSEDGVGHGECDQTLRLKLGNGFHERKEYIPEEKIYLDLLKAYPTDKKLEFIVSLALSNCYFALNRMEEWQQWLEKAEHLETNEVHGSELRSD